MKKKIFSAAMAAVMLFSVCLTGCGSSAAKATNGVVNVYNWGEYIDESIFDEFTAKTGIKVVYTTYDSNESMYAKLKSGSVNYDVIIPSDYMIGRLISENMLKDLDFSKIPNYANINDSYKNLEYDPDGKYSVSYMWGTTGIIYNSKMISKPLTSWKDLFDESKVGTGNVLMFDNSRDSIGIALMALGYPLNTTDASQIKEAVDLLISQKESGIVQAYVMDQIFDKMENGEAAVGVYYAGDYITMVEDNPDLVWVQPKEGSNLFVDAMCVPTCCENYDNAMAFINFMCSDDACLANCDVTGYSTPSSTALALMDSDVTGNTVAYPSNEFLAKCQTYVSLDADTLALYDSEWTRLGISSAG